MVPGHARSICGVAGPLRWSDASCRASLQLSQRLSPPMTSGAAVPVNRQATYCLCLMHPARLPSPAHSHEHQGLLRTTSFTADPVLHKPQSSQPVLTPGRVQCRHSSAEVAAPLTLSWTHGSPNQTRSTLRERRRTPSAPVQLGPTAVHSARRRRRRRRRAAAGGGGGC